MFSVETSFGCLSIDRKARFYDTRHVLFFIRIIIKLLASFSTLADGLPLESNDSQSPQVSRTLLSVLTVLNNAVWSQFCH